MQKSNEQPTNPARYDRELEVIEDRGMCPQCFKYSMVNYTFEQPTNYTRFCLECGHKEGRLNGFTPHSL